MSDIEAFGRDHPARDVSVLLLARWGSAHADAYRRFLDDTQDPILGYWGPWIMSGEKLFEPLTW